MDMENIQALEIGGATAAAGSRNLSPDGYLKPNWANVLEAGEPCKLYVSWNAKMGDEYRLLNTTSHTATVHIENDTFYIEAVDQAPSYTLEVPAGSMMYSIVAYSEQFQRRQLFASVTEQAGNGGPGPGGDYLPKNNPTYTGTLSGPLAKVGKGQSLMTVDPDGVGFKFNTPKHFDSVSSYLTMRGDAGVVIDSPVGNVALQSWGGSAVLSGTTFASVVTNQSELGGTDGRTFVYGPKVEIGVPEKPTVGPITHGFTIDATGINGETSGNVNVHGRYMSLTADGDLWIDSDKGPLTLRAFGGQAQLLSPVRALMSSRDTYIGVEPTKAWIHSPDVAIGVWNYGQGKLTHAVTINATGVGVTHAPVVADPPVEVLNILPHQLVTKAQVEAMGGPGNFLPKDDPIYTGDMKGDNLEVALLGVTGNIAIGEDDDQHVLIDYNSVNMTGPMGESKLTLSPYMLQAGGMYSFDVQSTIVGFEASTVDIEAVTSEHGLASMRIKSGEQLDITAKNMFIETPYGKLEARAWAGMKLIGGDLSTAANIQILPYGIQFQAGPEDEATFGITAEGSLFGTNPVVAHLKPVATMLDHALVAKSQVVEVLNTARSLPQAPIIFDGSEPSPSVGTHGTEAQYYLAGGDTHAVVAQSTPDHCRFRITNILGTKSFIRAEPRTDGEYDLLYDMSTGLGVDPGVGVPTDHNSVWEVIRIPHQGGSGGTTILCYPIHLGMPLTTAQRAFLPVVPCGTTGD